MPPAAGSLALFHADSLEGPMRALAAAFQAGHPGAAVRLTGGTSRRLAERILAGEACDLFASSSPAIIETLLMGKPLAGQEAAAWYLVFSANEMVVITRPGNPLGIRGVADLARPGLTFVRVTGGQDLGAGRTLEFLRRAAALEGEPALAQRIVEGAAVDPARDYSVPETVQAVASGRADAGVVYLSAAVAAGGAVEILRFPAGVNLSDQIQNAATVPGTARNRPAALEFILGMLSAEGRAILLAAGQPPVIPPMWTGDLPAELGG